jgi:hypothetical protein
MIETKFPPEGFQSELNYLSLRQEKRAFLFVVELVRREARISPRSGEIHDETAPEFIKVSVFGRISRIHQGSISHCFLGSFTDFPGGDRWCHESSPSPEL